MAIAIVAALGAVFWVLIWMTFSLLTVRKERIRNDDQVAKDTFLEVLNSAKKTLTVRDDGDATSSLYFDDDVAKQVRARLRDNPRLAMRVLFNYREDGNKLAELQAELRGRDRLDIRYLSSSERPFKGNPQQDRRQGQERMPLVPRERRPGARRGEVRLLQILAGATVRIPTLHRRFRSPIPSR